MDYKFLTYETDKDGIVTITLNRPPVNAFNYDMRRELSIALDRFNLSLDERVLILTGAGKYFSTGEDLDNINLDADDMEMTAYVSYTLAQYHKIVREILGIGKPIIAMLNGVTAGSGLSIALACDYRYVPLHLARYHLDMRILNPVFASMGLIADAGMTATLTRFIGQREAQRWCETPGVIISIAEAIKAGVVEITDRDDYANNIANVSATAYAFSKKMRNSALIRELNKYVFPWEIRAQTECLQSEYFKQKAQEFFARRLR